MYHFIVNIHGGSGKAFLKWNKIRALLKERRVAFKTHVPQKPGHACQIARAISESDETDIRIVVVGGDGTINEVLNGISDFSKVKFGLIPTGSGNDFARGLGLPRHNPAKALGIMLNSAGTEKIDLGKTTVLATGESRIFGISSGFGLDAIVGTGINGARIKKILNYLHVGKLSYAVFTIQTLFSMKTCRAAVSFDGGHPLAFDKMIFLAAMNFRAEGGGVPMTPHAVSNDGLISVCIAAGVPKWLTFFLFPFLCLGLHEKLRGFFLKNCRSLEVHTDLRTVVHTDGELLGTAADVRFEILPGMLSVLV